MPKVTMEHKEQRRQEIIDACEKIYCEKGFQGVTIKEISTATSFTRPAIYTYFETKDEILLALLNREYEIWCSALEKLKDKAEGLSREKLAEGLAHTLDGRDILLRIQNMNLFEIEINSRVERLAEFKVLYRRSVELLTEIIKVNNPYISSDECTDFCMRLNAFLFGVYPFVHHTEKQIKAMELANVQFTEISEFEMIYGLIMKLIP